ncbi:MAG TPA: insulinase family protein [Pyrinomonadaceae bacterium]|jgi:predicted Zn-dependent peptidase|nr:insulinase family protein [Pyrinomonadaceae bacterium]
MLKSNPARLLVILLLAVSLLHAGRARTHAQSAPEPRREQLLNGLRILMLGRPGEQNVTLRMRIHSGAAFDLAGKEGQMALLAGAFFDPNTREYVTEELNGRLEVKTSYDSIDVTLAGRLSDFERLLELLRNGVVNIQLTPEAVERVRAEAVKSASAASASGAAAGEADRLVAARLFAPFPYARPVAGTAESLARVERTDLMLARERFLNPDNATLVIVGDINPTRTLRILRSSMGGWRKSDRAVPSTFRRPEPPDARTLVVGRPGAQEVELRVAWRGLARTDRDAAAVRLLEKIVRDRLNFTAPGASAVVRHEAMREGGIFKLGATLPSAAAAARTLEAARKVVRDLSETGPTASELEAAKAAVVSAVNQSSQGADSWADAWLDEHTFNSTAIAPEQVVRSVNALNASEVQRVAARLFLHTPVASVAVGDPAQLREELARTGGFEVFGEAAAQTGPPPPPKPVKPQPDNKPRLELKRP